MQVICLGTASCYPTVYRSVSCTAIRFEDGNIWLFDCGEGSQIQFQKSCLKPGRITKIFITHLHGDHVFGLPGFICTLGQCLQPDSVIEIYGPLGLRKFLRQSLCLSRSALPYTYIVHELVPVLEQYPADWGNWTVDHEAAGSLHPQEKMGRDITVEDGFTWNLFTDESAGVKAGLIHHTIPSFGFVVKEKDRPGKLKVDLLLELGVKPGPLFARIKNGETVLTAGGEVIDPSKVVGPPKRGKKVTILGDTSDPFKMADIARNSDILLHEATMENSLETKALEFGHSTPNMAATFARSVGAKKLVLFHFSQRYKDSKEDQANSVIGLLEEARQALVGDSCQVVLGEDLLVLDVPHPS